MIERITPWMLDERILREFIYPRMEETIYWSDSWDPEFYLALASAGFICISYRHRELGPLLIAELQESYAVLDWENLHCSRKLRKLLSSGRLEEEGVELRVADASDHVLAGLADYHTEDSWLHEPYQALVRKLDTLADRHFAIHGIELWSDSGRELVAGELGYSIGSTYTSLSGFCNRKDRKWRHFGTLQQILLARTLEERGYAFWNMGHVSMPYKRALGARVVPRTAFLKRWLAAREVPSPAPLS